MAPPAAWKASAQDNLAQAFRPLWHVRGRVWGVMAFVWALVPAGPHGTAELVLVPRFWRVRLVPGPLLWGSPPSWVCAFPTFRAVTVRGAVVCPSCACHGGGIVRLSGGPAIWAMLTWPSRTGGAGVEAKAGFQPNGSARRPTQAVARHATALKSASPSPSSPGVLRRFATLGPALLARSTPADTLGRAGAPCQAPHVGGPRGERAALKSRGVQAPLEPRPRGARGVRSLANGRRPRGAPSGARATPERSVRTVPQRRAQAAPEHRTQTKRPRASDAQAPPPNHSGRTQHMEHDPKLETHFP